MKVVVAGGGTVAPIDDVRTIANISSGRFAATISEACLERGATVWHIHAPSARLPFLRSAQFDLDASDLDAEHRRLDQVARRWRSYRDRLHLMPLTRGTVDEYAFTLERVLRSETVDVIFLAMAVSDYEPTPTAGKLDSDEQTLVIRCHRTTKVIQSVRDWAPSAYLAGFKLLSGSSVEQLIDEARAACLVNRADLTIANDLRTLQEGRHTVHLVRSGHPVETLGPDPSLAEKLVDRVFTWTKVRPHLDACSPGDPSFA